MAKRIVAMVTITGADDSIRPEQLIHIMNRFPFVEFGILLAKKQQGGRRFPSWDWLEGLCAASLHNPLALSGHICGNWVRDLCVGEPTFLDDIGYLFAMFRRFQLNFHGEPHEVDIQKFGRLLEKRFSGKQVIFQMDGNPGNHQIFASTRAFFDVDAHPLFDSSGGCGKLPGEWPRPIGRYCGYAGGLSPANVQEELEKISQVTAGSPFWIDTETRVRSNSDKLFDLDKVWLFLETVKPWVIGART